MKTRLHLQNDTVMIEWADTPTGLLQAKAFRKARPEFRGRHIRSVVQTDPERVECGTMYVRNYDKSLPIKKVKNR